MLVTPLPQEEFNPTDDRKTIHPSLGVTCLDCHVNDHPRGKFHLTSYGPRKDDFGLILQVYADSLISRYMDQNEAYVR